MRNLYKACLVAALLWMSVGASAQTPAAQQFIYPRSDSPNDSRYLYDFRKYKGPMIDRANLKGRRVFRIGNPFMTPQTPFNRRELWFDPLAGR